MSAIHNLRFKECKVQLVRLTKEEIEKYTGKTYNEAEEVADSTTDHKPTIFIRREIQEASTMDTNKMEEIDECESDEEDDDINNINNVEIDENEETEDTYAGSNILIDNMILQQYEMDTNEEPEDISYMENNVEMNGTGGIDNPTNGYIHNVFIKQEVQDDGYDVYASQIAGSSMMIKQEVVDESYNQSYVTQGYDNMYGEYIPNILVNEPTQNFGMQSYINPGISNITNGSNSYVIIKQEILDEGNIETYTNVLRPSADQEYEDGGPW